MAKLWQFLQRHPKPAFSLKVQGRDQGKFFKIAQKVALDSMGQQHSGTNGIILVLVCTYSAKTGEDFGENSGSKSARMAELWRFLARSPKTRIF